MIIIPADQALNWRNPPIATLLLIVINCVVFFAYQSGDDERYRNAVSFYVESGLLEREATLYLDFIEETEGAGERHALTQQAETYSLTALGYYVVSDLEFSAHLKQLASQASNDQEKNLLWDEKRETFTTMQRSLSYIAYGFVPAEFSIQGFFGNMFLHGDLNHLFGNMLFLFVCGFALEIAFGRGWYLLLYLAAGCLSTGFSYLTNMNGYIPGIGASGAVSGLMGMYVGLYGMRKIQFFYWILIFFGYFTAPALLIFPIWIANELYGYLYSDNNINYMAHLGGLVAGFAAVYLVKGRFVEIDEVYVEKALSQDEIQSEKVEEMWTLMGKLRFKEAWSAGAALLKEDPTNRQLLQQMYNLSKAKPDDERLHKLTRKIVQLPAPNVEFEHFRLLILEDYFDVAHVPRAMTSESCIDMIAAACKYQYIDLSYAMAEFLMALSTTSKPIENSNKSLLRVFMIQLKAHKSKRVDTILEFLKAHSTEEYEMAKESALLASR